MAEGIATQRHIDIQFVWDATNYSVRYEERRFIDYLAGKVFLRRLERDYGNRVIESRAS